MSQTINNFLESTRPFEGKFNNLPNNKVESSAYHFDSEAMDFSFPSNDSASLVVDDRESSKVFIKEANKVIFDKTTKLSQSNINPAVKATQKIDKQRSLVKNHPNIFSHPFILEPEFYKLHNPDLSKAKINSEVQLKGHWLRHRIHEDPRNAKASRTFNSVWYMKQYPDLEENGINTTVGAVQHYAFFGRFENRKSSALTSDILYDEGLKLDIYQPANPKEEEFPIVIAFVGGGWKSSDKQHPSMQTMGFSFAKNRVAMISAEYHTAPEHKHPAQMYNIDSLLKYVKNNASKMHWDIDNITLLGGSAGGHIALLHAMNPEFDENPNLPKVKNVIAISPGTDLTNVSDNQKEELVSNFLGWDYAAKAQDASPITYANLPSDKRFYISYGLHDKTTPPDSQALPFINEMHRVGQDITFKVHPKGAHGNWQNPSEKLYKPEFVGNMAEWIKKATNN